jgi:hypothetical protein
VDRFVDVGDAAVTADRHAAVRGIEDWKGPDGEKGSMPPVRRRGDEAAREERMQ